MCKSVLNTIVFKNRRNVKKGEENMKLIKLNVEGMACGHCTANVEKTLTAAGGVNAKASLENKTAEAMFDDSVTAASIIEKIEALGFDASEA